MILLKGITLSVFILALSACAQTQIVSVTNDTVSDLSVSVDFDNKHGKQTMDFLLPPGSTDSWRYESYFWQPSIIQKDFRKLKVSNEKGCLVEYDRQAIEDETQEKPWEFVIDKRACDSP